MHGCAFLILLFVGFSSETVASPQEGQFWQITDIHLEVNYTRNGNPNDDCRPGFREENVTLGAFGEILCDSPKLLLNDAADAMKRIYSTPQFILWTGDNVPHLNLNEVSWEMIFRGLNETTAVIKSRFPDSILVPVMGNHDAHPRKNVSWETFSDYSARYLTEGGWGDLIPIDEEENWKKGGYYSVYINPKLTILVVNTFLYVQRHEEFDPKGQFSWLTQRLREAETNDSYVIVTSHIPPGIIDNKRLLQPDYNKKYLEILERFSHVILTQIYGHLHDDTFKLFYNENDHLVSHAFMAPSITPWTWVRPAEIGNNPSVRLYKYSLSYGIILDYDQYNLNISLANEQFEEGIAPPGPWNLLYTATKLYHVPNLNKTSLEELFQKISTDQTVFETYARNFKSGQEFKCVESCAAELKCNVIGNTIDQYKKCLQNYS